MPNITHEPGLYYQGFGGVEEVAGSKHVFILKKPDGGIDKILHDCGSTMEDNKEDDAETQTKLPFQADNISSVVLSHAHFDHVGDVWKLPVNGYDGFYFGQLATKDMLKIDLTEQAGHESYQANVYNKQIKGKKDAQGRFLPFKKPLFTTADAHKIVNNAQGMQYGIPVRLTDNISATFYDAGHILGSSQVLYEINDNGKVIKVLTAVDLGRSTSDVPIINPPHNEFSNDIDYVFIESTYGGNKHESRQQSREELEEIIIKAYEKKSEIVIGAFAKMRTHQILSDLFWIYKRANLPEDFRVYLDSPTAIKINSLIIKHPECLDEQARADFSNRRENPFKFPNLEIVRTTKRSEELDSLAGPYAIISASGMYFMGRIVRHLKHHIENKNSLLILTGWQKPGCTGWQLEQGHDTVNIEGQSYKRNAQVVRMHGYGGHADGQECVDHVINYAKPRKGVYIVHGEEKQLQWTHDELRKRLPANISVDIVRKGQTYNFKPHDL